MFSNSPSLISPELMLTLPKVTRQQRACDQLHTKIACAPTSDAAPGTPIVSGDGDHPRSDRGQRTHVRLSGGRVRTARALPARLPGFGLGVASPPSCAG